MVTAGYDARYDDLLPTDKDRIRAQLGDVDMANPLLSDQHILAVLAAEASLPFALGWLADELVAVMSQDPVRVGENGAVLDFSARIPAWKAIADRFRPVTPVPGAAGQSALSFVTATYDQANQPDEYGRPEVWRRF